ncbi:MAG TPA: response regulator [Alphaproteobacteria bacterium]|jgi:hypothetical protein
MTTILVVEDSPTQAQKLIWHLEAEGLQVVAAPTGERALEMLDETDVDLVISDIMMPGISGYDLCRRIKANADHKHIPVILLTTLKDPLDIVQGLESGADNFVTKPYEPEQLLKRLNTVLENRRLVAEGKIRVGFEVSFLGRRFAITSDRQQILDLLISTFEQIVEANHELERRREDLAVARARIENYARQLEEKVEVTEAKYQTILQNIGDAIVTVDQDGRILTFNQAAERLFQRDAKDAIGTNSDEIIHLPENLPLTAAMKRYLDHASSLYVNRGAREITGKRKDGTTFPFEVVVTDVSIAGDWMLCLSGRDITDQKQLEADLRQAQKMDAIGQLTGGISHDFNNLLTVVIGNLQLLEDSLTPDSKSAQWMKSALGAAMRGADLTKRLLAFARKQVLDPQVWNVNELVRGMEDLLRRPLGDNIDCKLDLAANLPLTRIDHSQLEHALLNLVINARDAMAAGGRLTIETGSESLDAVYAARHAEVTAGPYVMIAVSDTGGGMPAEVIERAFEPFFTTKGEGRGTGLGLSMVYGFIKQSGGHIKIYSEVGHGTTIKLYLPVEEGAQVAMAEARNSAVQLATAGETILLVEDDPDVRDVGASILGRLGYKVIEAENGKAAIDILESNQKIDLLFTDIMMKGGMSGVELSNKARAKWPRLKILFCSGFAESAIAGNKSLEPGTYFISKPYDRKKLSEILRKILDR